MEHLKKRDLRVASALSRISFRCTALGCLYIRLCCLQLGDKVIEESKRVIWTKDVVGKYEEEIRMRETPQTI